MAGRKNESDSSRRRFCSHMWRDGNIYHKKNLSDLYARMSDWNTVWVKSDSVLKFKFVAYKPACNIISLYNFAIGGER